MLKVIVMVMVIGQGHGFEVSGSAKDGSLILNSKREVTQRPKISIELAQKYIFLTKSYVIWLWWWWWWVSTGHSFLHVCWLQIEVGAKSLSLVWTITHPLTRPTLPPLLEPRRYLFNALKWRTHISNWAIKCMSLTWVRWNQQNTPQRLIWGNSGLVG